MILQLVKKDWKLLWPLVALVAVLHALVESSRHQWAITGEESMLDVLEPIANVVWLLLAAAVVHQDRIPGTQQDWLIRPIPRVRLLAAKLLFLALFLHGPLFIANVIGAASAGFSLEQSLAAAAMRGALTFCVYTLPVAALAAVTRNLMELLIFGVVLVMFVVPFDAACVGKCDTGFGWIVELARIAVIAAGALAVLGLQYGKQHALWRSRAAIVVVAICIVALGQLPWGFFFAAQQAVSASTGAAADVVIEIDPAAVRAAQPQPEMPPLPSREHLAVLAARDSLAGASSPEWEHVAREWAAYTGRRAAGETVSFGLAMSGVPQGSVLWADRVDVRLIDADGRVVFEGTGDELEVHSDGDRVHARQSVLVPTDVYERLKDEPLELRLDYGLTLLGPGAALSLAAVDGEGRLSGGVRCKTRQVRGEPVVQLRCLTVDPEPSCFSAALEVRSTSHHNREFLVCNPDYAPYLRGPTLFGRFGIDLPFDRAAYSERSAEPTEIGSAAVRLTPYVAREHFREGLVVERVRLVDWVERR